MSTISELFVAAQQRTLRARAIAEEARGNDRLHKLSMATVFILEDLEFALAQMVEDGAAAERREEPGRSI